MISAGAEVHDYKSMALSPATPPVQPKLIPEYLGCLGFVLDRMEDDICDTNAHRYYH